MKKSPIAIITIALLGQGQTPGAAQNPPATGPQREAVQARGEEPDGPSETAPDLLHKAAREGDPVQLRRQLARGANVNARDALGFAPLESAKQAWWFL